MDLRAKLSDRFARLAYDVFKARGIIGTHNHLPPHEEYVAKAIEEAAASIRAQFVSHSIPFPLGVWVETKDDELVTRFLDKYPELHQIISVVEGEARRRWPECRIELVLHSDPECCHICKEGQSLGIEIHAGLSMDGPCGESEWDYAHEAWMEWLCDSKGSFRQARRALGDVGDLVGANLMWQPNDGEE